MSVQLVSVLIDGGKILISAIRNGSTGFCVPLEEGRFELIVAHCPISTQWDRYWWWKSRFSLEIYPKLWILTIRVVTFAMSVAVRMIYTCTFCETFLEVVQISPRIAVLLSGSSRISPSMPLGFPGSSDSQ